MENDSRPLFVALPRTLSRSPSIKAPDRSASDRRPRSRGKPADDQEPSQTGANPAGVTIRQFGFAQFKVEDVQVFGYAVRICGSRQSDDVVLLDKPPKNHLRDRPSVAI